VQAPSFAPVGSKINPTLFVYVVPLVKQMACVAGLLQFMLGAKTFSMFPTTGSFTTRTSGELCLTATLSFATEAFCGENNFLKKF
jgi:hypothetical protein